jgi:DNA repair protein RadC
MISPLEGRPRASQAETARRPKPSLVPPPDEGLTVLLAELDLFPKDWLDVLAERFESAGDLLHADPARLRLAGLSAETIARLDRLKRLLEHLSRDTVSRRPVISSWTSLVAYVRVALAHRPREQLRVLYLDKKNRLLADEFLAEGSVDHAPVYPREILRQALETGASAMILVHNHPSGNPQPSQADIAMTRKVVDAARVFDIPIHDHLVVGRDGTVSLRSLGLLK